MEKDYTIPQVAAMLEKTPKKIWRLVRAGQMGSYRIGATYYVRPSDLEAYFARQGKKLSVLQGTTDQIVIEDDDPPTGGASSVGVRRRMPQFVVGSDEGSHQAEPPQDAHASAASSADSRADESQRRPTGEMMISGREAHTQEADYVERFRKMFHQPLALPHPATDEMIKLDNWSGIEQREDDLTRLGHLLNTRILRQEQQSNYPQNLSVLYWVEPRSLGGILRRYPKEGLVIECAALARLERYVELGYDDQALTAAELERAVQKRIRDVQLWSSQYQTPVTYLVGFLSVTGWDQSAVAFLRKQIDHPQLISYLVDRAGLIVHTQPHNRLALEYRDLFEQPLHNRIAEQLQQQIKELLLQSGAISLKELQERIGQGESVLREACQRLAKEDASYTFERLGESSVIRLR